MEWGMNEERKGSDWSIYLDKQFLIFGSSLT